MAPLLALAEKEIGPILWHTISQADGLEGITATYTKLLECMRDSAELRSIRPLRPKIALAELPSAKGDYAPLVLGVLDIIKRDYAKPLSLSRLSEQLFVHPTYLSNLFKKQTGMPHRLYKPLPRRESQRVARRPPQQDLLGYRQAGIVNHATPAKSSNHYRTYPRRISHKRFIRPIDKRSGRFIYASPAIA